LLLACGKSASDGNTPKVGGGGTNTAGVAATNGGAGDRAGSPASEGGKAATGGHAAAAGDASAAGGQAEAGAPSGGGADNRGGAATCSGSYRACGCGCCVGQPASLGCVYPELGQDLASIITADTARRQDTATCASAGCSAPLDYVCCESPPPAVEQATYTASLLIAAIDRIRIDKTATDCTSLTLRERSPGAPAPSGFPLETPTRWEVQQATRLACTSSSTKPLAIGALGKLVLRVVDDACVADVHLTLFFGDSTQNVDAERLDADALPIDLPLIQCE